MPEGNEQQPGTVIKPSSASNPTPDKTPAEATPEPTWQFKPEAAAPPSNPNPAPGPVGDAEGIQWEASEFVSHQKTAGWYGALALAAIVGAVLVYFFTRDKISTAMVVIVALALGVFATRKPRQLQYKLDEAGLTIGNKFYPYANFKSFAVVDEGALSAIWLIPLQRFFPAITMYYDPKDEEKIADLLAEYLPFEERSHDVVDRFMRKIRF